MPSASPRMLRYFCQVLPGAAGDLAYRYLVALAALPGRRCRAQPIGAVSYTSEPRWRALGHLFEEPVGHRFVNVVCAPMGLFVPRPPLPPALAIVLGPPPAPATALAGYHTASVPNLAITWPGDPWEAVTTLGYDAVIVPSLQGHEELTRHLTPEAASKTWHCPPEPPKLALLLKILGV